MKKIAILATSNETNGGTFQYTIKMIETLISSQKYIITIFTDINNNNFDHYNCKISKINIAKKYWIKYLFLYLFNKKLTNLFDKNQLIISPTYSPLLLVSNIPFIFTLHDLQEKYYPKFFTISTLFWRNFIYKLLVKKSKKIICESDYVKKDVQKFYPLSKNKIHIIQSPPIKLKFTLNELNNLSVIEKFNLNSKKYLIYPAQFWKHKNHINLIFAFKKLVDISPDLKLVLTGKFRFEFKKIQNIVIKLNLVDNIVFTDYLTEKDLIILIKNSSVLVMPTLFESISIPVFEAFQLGTAVCSSNVVGLPDQIGNAGLLFNPHSVEDIFNKLHRLILDDNLKSEIIQNGYKKILKITDQDYFQALDILIQHSI